MPPPPPRETPPHLPPHANESNTVLPNATGQQNTRALLRSLEELRDSLSTRVEELSNAVERLRGQAGELERALEDGRDIAVGWGPNGVVTQDRVQREPRDPTRSRQRARDIVHAFENRINPISVPASAPTSTITLNPSPITRELSRPITSSEIHTLLDRASASPAISSTSSPPRSTQVQSQPQSQPASQPTPNTNGPTDPWLTRAQSIETRIERLSETARELRSRATQSLNDNNTTGIQNNGNSQPRDILRGLLSRTREIREDQARLYENLRVLQGDEPEREESEARTPQVVQPTPMSRRQRSHQGSRGIISRNRGLQPTNIQQITRQPAPEIVRSTPVSPASTIRPIAETCNDVLAQPIMNDAAFNPSNGSQLNVNDNPSSDRPSSNPNASQASHSTGAGRYRGDLMELARNIVEGISNPLPPTISSSTSTEAPWTLTAPATVPAPASSTRRNNANTNRDDSLTFRGRRVAAQMGEQPSNSNSNDEMSENDVLRTWPFLRQFLQNPNAPLPTIQRPPARGTIQLNRRDTPESRGESTRHETSRLIHQIHDRDDHPRILNGRNLGVRSNGMVENYRSVFRNSNGNSTSGNTSGNNTQTRTRTRTNDYITALSRVTGDLNSPEDEDGDSPQEHTVVVIDMTTNPPTTQHLPRFMSPQRRSTEERERIRTDRQVANERVIQTRENLGNLTLNQNSNSESTFDNDIETMQRVNERASQMLERFRNERVEGDIRRARIREETINNRNSNTTSNSNLNMNEIQPIDLGLTPGLGLNVEIDIIEQPILSPTQGISMADLEDGMEGVMRALVINHDDEDSEGESGSDSSSGSGSGEGTIFEGAGERTENRRAQNNRPTDAVLAATTIIDQRTPPKESFDVNLHLWPSHYALAGL